MSIRWTFEKEAHMHIIYEAGVRHRGLVSSIDRGLVSSIEVSQQHRGLGSSIEV